jgi:hypothetical protein
MYCCAWPPWLLYALGHILLHGAAPYFRSLERDMRTAVVRAAAVCVRLTTGVSTHGSLQQPTAVSHYSRDHSHHLLSMPQRPACILRCLDSMFCSMLQYNESVCVQRTMQCDVLVDPICKQGDLLQALGSGEGWLLHLAAVVAVHRRGAKVAWLVDASLMRCTCSVNPCPAATGENSQAR